MEWFYALLQLVWNHVADDTKESWPCTYKAVNCKDPYGSISPYISNLTFLRFINLQNNSFYGEIPHEVGHLFWLQTLNLNNNTLEGETPSNLSNRSYARFINLLWNELHGRIPVELGSLLKLQTLQLSGNNLTGETPTSLVNISSLTILTLSDNKLVVNIPNGIGNLKSLYFFSISVNNLRYNPLLPLQYIISPNHFIFRKPTWRYTSRQHRPHSGLTLPYLNSLLFGNNKFSVKIPVSLWHLCFKYLI